MASTQESIAAKNKPKKFRYKVLLGHHSHNFGTDENPDITTYRQGDEFDSDIELDKRFNAPGTMKFQRIGVNVEDSEESLDELEQELAKRRAKLKAKKTPVEDAQPSDEFDAMTTVQLIEYASDNDIDLGKAKSKEQILKVIRSFLVVA